MSTIEVPNDLGRLESPSFANPLEEINPEGLGGEEQPEQPVGPTSPLDGIEEDVKLSLIELIDQFEDEDRYVRENQVRKWKRYECYWNDLQHVFWSNVSGEWVQPTDEEFSSLGLEGVQPEDYEKVINIFKAHGESIIAALSVQPPGVSFYPDDADNPLDLSTAKGYSRIAELLQKHNESTLLFINALYHRWIEGVVFCYNYYDKDKEYGTISQPQFEMVDQTNTTAECPQCGAPMFAEDTTCPDCGYQGPPEVSMQTFKVPQLIGYTDEPKGREKLEIYGPLHCKVAQNARRQKDTPYLIMSFEQHFSMMRDLYPWIYDKIQPDYPNKDYYERQARTGVQFLGQYPDNLVAVRCAWIRPWAFLSLKNKELALKLNQLYPKGVYVVKVGDELADVREEALDDHWTVSIDPFSTNLHATPLGQPLVPVQDMTNELFRLTIETVEYGIPETFVDSEVLDLDKFQEQELRPGNLTAAKSPPGGNLSQGFHTLHSATLSQEVEPFAARLEAAGQFIPGSFPSIYGGPAQKGSKTASEYSQSRAQALQRLSTHWKAMSRFWANAVSRATTEFAQNMMDDERDVVKQGSGFVNVVIKKMALQGKVGKVEPEITDDLPLTQSQKRDLLLRLFELQLPEVNSVIFAPVNANLVKLAVGMPEFNIPGEEDRNKQFDEIQVLLQSQPMDESGMMSSVAVDQEVENHIIEAEVLRDWLVSEEGQYNKRVNPAGYMNCVAHFREHNMLAAQQQLAQQQAEQEQENSDGGGQENGGK